MRSLFVVFGLFLSQVTWASLPPDQTAAAVEELRVVVPAYVKALEQSKGEIPEDDRDKKLKDITVSMGLSAVDLLRGHLPRELESWTIDSEMTVGEFLDWKQRVNEFAQDLEQSSNPEEFFTETENAINTAVGSRVVVGRVSHGYCILNIFIFRSKKSGGFITFSEEVCD